MFVKKILRVTCVRGRLAGAAGVKPTNTFPLGSSTLGVRLGNACQVDAALLWEKSSQAVTLSNSSIAMMDGEPTYSPIVIWNDELQSRRCCLLCLE